MAVDKYLTYRGDIRAVAADGATLLFTTVHPEGRPTGVYRLDAETGTGGVTPPLQVDDLPCGGTTLIADAGTVWVGGTDGRLYRIAAGGSAVAVGPTFTQPPAALAPLADDRLAVLAGVTIAVLSRRDGKRLQALELPEAGTCLAADPTGKWLVAGTAKGLVAVYDGEDKDEFLPSESARLHEGAVTALLFERDELRFFSAGADQKLLTTHARGTLEPEDKGRGNTHTDLVMALVWGPADRFFSGSRDAAVKTWPRVGGVRPATLKDGVGPVTALAVVPVHDGRGGVTPPLLVAACDDNTLRYFTLDEEGKFGDRSFTFHGAADWAQYELAQSDPARREAALRTLAEWDDAAAVELLASQMGKDADHGLRLLAVNLLGGCRHPRAAALLPGGLNHADEAVRLAAFQGLRKRLGESDLRPMDLALASDKADVGKAAVQAMEALAARDDRALARLTAALDSRTYEIRQAALLALERVRDPRSPEADLQGLASKYSDVRWTALLRFFQRRLLSLPAVQSAVRRRGEDDNADVRRVAFLATLAIRPTLAHVLRTRDTELQRQLTELESSTKTTVAMAAASELDESDYDVLLQATASRALDTCLRGARGLAVLRDPRAFGLLLQLSREDNAAARGEVCRALEALDDPRGVKRLRSLLYDPEAAVRDAAFTALEKIHSSDPLLAAESGLNAAHEDVRRRGLQALVAAARKAPPTGAAEPTWQLLTRALNDAAPTVRGEAFKAALNLQIAGGGVQTLRFVLQSIHADVRLEVLTEMMAQADQPWAWNLLLEFYNDHDPTLRSEAFEFAVKKAKDLGPLETGLASQYADVRRKAVEGLVKKHSRAAQDLLLRALADPEKAIRQLALGELVGADARAALLKALESPHADVRVRAARALARHGDAMALRPLLALVSAPEPEERERRPDWSALVQEALAGLGELGDVTALGHVAPLLKSGDDVIRKAAAQALSWVAAPVHPETLRQALQHADPQVKYNAALGLAYAGDPVVASLVFSDAVAQVLTPDQRLTAAFALGPAGEDQLAVFLDAAEEPLRKRALLLMMLLEMKANAGSPTRCLTCLSSRAPRVRLTAARALECFSDFSFWRIRSARPELTATRAVECFSDPMTFVDFVAQLFNDRGDEPAWKVAPDVVETVAELLVHGPPMLRARTARLLRTLEEKEQSAWDQEWEALANRFKGEIAEARRKARERRPAAYLYTEEQLRQLAFGAYVGLVREQGGAAGATPPVVRVRQTALSRILALTKGDPQYARAARPVLIQALGDPNQPVRNQAFEHLQTLGMDAQALGAEALETGHTDMGVRGLQLLSGGASSPEGQAVLERVMLSRTDGLALEALKLLAAHRGPTRAATPALSAASAEVRSHACYLLNLLLDTDPAAREALRQALSSRYPEVRKSAALALAGKKDPAAFGALVSLLAEEPDPKKQRPLIFALTTLGDPRTPAAFLDRLENDPGGTAPGDALLEAVGQFRRPEVADRLLALMEKSEKWRKAAFDAALAVSGHDQPIDDPEEEKDDRSWEEKQFPRYDAVLARLMDRCFAMGETKLMLRLLPAARWAKGKEVEPILSLLAAHPDDKVRQQAVEALGWRLRKRHGSADALLKALGHRDPQTQFLAAEGLARGGRAEGLSVLLSSVEYLSDVGLRQRAVSALGELGDPRALDLLMTSAKEDGHALQEEAAEAVGRFGGSAKREEIFQLLERLAKGNGGVAAKALKGLRWLNTRGGWQIIRRRAGDEAFSHRDAAVALLGHDDDPATRELLLRLLATNDDGTVVDAALAGARRLWGMDSLEPDYALVQNSDVTIFLVGEESDEAVRRVCVRGDAARIFAVLPKCPPEAQQALATSLLNRPDPPLAEARAALAGEDEHVVRLAARVLGRAGKAADAGKALASALAKWRAAWEERRAFMVRRNVERDDRLTNGLTPCVAALAWAAGRLGAARDLLPALLAARPADPLYRPVRLEAVAALAAGPASEPVLAALEAAALGDDTEVRTRAAEAVGRLDPRRGSRLAEKELSDRPSLSRLASCKGVDVKPSLRSAAGQVHYQGAALPLLVDAADAADLAAVAANRGLPEKARFGAVEALGAMARESAEEPLRRIGQAADEPEELRKAAWRALRRSKRARQAGAGAKS